ncbi:hypothetical protein [Flavobacterium johnsoniae]|uniref:Uncharacterized protein n=1 Tax=Flavobacterium johnsoniae (strain ATCC 17061 / DSM 2064 / JCM 8514 / BCRC 14874 / CCUG 350202 / NBRC 14942 / NCIMB 11054 / UW101) TaxID=376686 RepID=A5FIV6_FLAJ1|nr:hypothetical protein [Flavobacterium johnsoniae]ABQ04865.1 hypothetical protein Fjoh_1833 [Flavobacterium johnsoniae UW101]OXG02936.1 hypothetical protein B0A63_01385 [Flavobacterium johnsoniae UW101]WQG83336.1 hypothetical protein SR927_09525 [Flavobacterium johnsoniae UW101]SHK36964.1 hypothetical protein SAMN05444146_1284 [Flavobacterium johnsoniae]
MEKITAFFDHPFFIIVGGISTLIAILAFLYSTYIIFTGIIPIWIRLGKGLSNKKIAIYAEQEFDNLKDLLLDSGLFKEKNIERISINAMKKGERHTMMLVNYIEFSDRIPEILKCKKDSDSLIIYAPQKDGRIEQQVMDEINENRNSIVVNFRGRLLNDIITSMITTSSYEKR